MMARHAPYPALVCDRYWTVRDANASAQALLSPLIEGGEMNIIRMLTEHPLAAEMVVNLGEVLNEMLGRIRLEALEMGADPVHAEQVRALEAALRRHPAPKATAPRSPLVPVAFRGPDRVYRFLSAVAHFGTSEDVTVRDLRLELLFPADDETRAAFGTAPANQTSGAVG